ncbi:MAG: methyltransferase domain-containing protein [Bdellovibrionales bacterium]|nr:methyltransferase domain-containing protein [Bdellovibrionales bacterium]
MDTRSVATEHTLAFILKNLPPHTKNILEVGCGLGHLAEALHHKGYHVLAIDTSEEAVTATRHKGITAHQAKIEDIREKDFDAILFTRCLHHIHPMESALQAARRKLSKNSVILIEDFGFDLLDEESAEVTGTDLAKWIKHHTEDHSVHPFEDISEAINIILPGAHIEIGIPYLYRYENDPDFAEEQKLINEGKMVGIGFRAVYRQTVAAQH